jgi:hypothetical protein
MKTPNLFLLVAWAAVAGLAGCATFEPGPLQVFAVDSVMAEALLAARAPAAEQKAALARAQESFAREASSVNRVRLGALLATLPAPLRDDARAIELLEPIADATSPGAGRFAAVLSTQVAERQRLAREADRLHRESDRLARERERAEKERERLERDRERIDKERERIDRERDKREETLKQQLEALRSIERGILEREERLRRKPR